MTDVPPWPSKQGPKARTIGVEPAGGCARGAAAVWPQNGIGASCGWPASGAAAGAAALGASCAWRGAATNRSAATAAARKPWDIDAILDCRAGRLAFHLVIEESGDRVIGFARLPNDQITRLPDQASLRPASSG